MTKTEFINRVLLIMNEAGNAETVNIFTSGADNTQVDRYIEGSFVDSWRRCASVMPRSWFANKSFADYPIVPNLPDGTGYVIMPNDFYLLTSFKMSGWKKSVYDVSIENDRTEAINSNEWTRGSMIRPNATLKNKFVSNSVVQVINYYSLQKGLATHTVEEALYVPVAKPLSDPMYDNDADIGIDQRIFEPMAYLAASTVFTIFEKYNIAKALEEKVAQMFPIFTSVKGGTTTLKQ